MATDDTPLDRFLARAAATMPSDFVAPNRGDWSRLSRDSFISNRSISARSVRSEGDLRLHGVGVEMNSADLQAVGAIASAWQRAVSAVGAALEDVKSLRGALPAEVLQKTTLVLNASPQPGSVVLHIEPKSLALDEVEPDGDAPMVQPVRPLADRASEELIRLLDSAAMAPLDSADELSSAMSTLGPRVGSTVAALAQTLDRTNITLDAAWAEPETNSVRASVNPSQAKWIIQFVAGRGLDAEVQTVVGILRTVSDRERWLVQVGDDEVRMKASELDPAVAAEWHPGAVAELSVRVAQTERPDGTTRISRTILSVRAVKDGEAGVTR